MLATSTCEPRRSPNPRRRRPAGLCPRTVPAAGPEKFELTLRAVGPDNIVDANYYDIAWVTLTHVDYRSAAFHDMWSVNEAATSSGALVVWDLSHSAGAIELDLSGTGAELAVGCG